MYRSALPGFSPSFFFLAPHWLLLVAAVVVDYGAGLGDERRCCQSRLMIQLYSVVYPVVLLHASSWLHVIITYRFFPVGTYEYHE